MLRIMLALTLVGFLSNCVFVPTSGTLEWARASQVNIQPLKNGQTVAVVVKSEKYKPLRECMSNAIGDVIGEEKVLKSDLKNKAFYPLIAAKWNLSLQEDDALHTAIHDPQVVDSAKKHSVKYIVVLGEENLREVEDSVFLGLGAYVDARSYAELDSQLIDMESQNKVSDVRVEASASSSGFFSVIGIYSVIPLPQNREKACREMGTRLGMAFLSGQIKVYERPKDKPDTLDNNDENAR